MIEFPTMTIGTGGGGGGGGGGQTPSPPTSQAMLSLLSGSLAFRREANSIDNHHIVRPCIGKSRALLQ